MNEYVSFPMGADGSVIFEVDYGSTPLGIVDASRLGDAARQASMTLDQALDAVKPAISRTVRQLRLAMSELSPDEIEVEFGLKIHGTAGVIIASSSIEGNYTVKAVWRNQAE